MFVFTKSAAGTQGKLLLRPFKEKTSGLNPIKSYQEEKGYPDRENNRMNTDSFCP